MRCKLPLSGTLCVWLGVLGALSSLVDAARGEVLWRDRGPQLVCQGEVILDATPGAVEPQDDTSSKVLYFKFTVNPFSDAAVDRVWETRYRAGLVFCRNGGDRLGVGNGLDHHAYSAFTTAEQKESAPRSEGWSPSGERDLNAAFKEASGFLTCWPNRGQMRTILLKVQYVPDADDQVTVWFEPDLSPGNTESSQLPGQTTRFLADASFDELQLVHRGGGEGWRFRDLAIATSFEDFVPPPLWRRGWVLGPTVAALLGAVIGSVLFVERRRSALQMRRLAVERAMEQERIRIARDLHDELGTRLTEISMLAGQDVDLRSESAELRQSLQKIAAVTRETMRTTEGIVWAMNSRRDTLEDLVRYLVRFAEDFFRPSAIRCRLDVPVQVPSVRLSSPMRHQLLLAVKEACNNVACHSGATEVWLRLAVREHTLVISVEDDGHGFDPATASEHGNGLNNLRARMANVGGTAEISSVAGERTCVRLVVLLPGE